MRFTRHGKDTRTLIVELTPMIDVVFLLIIFFMTTAQFAQTTREDLDLPKERGEQHEESEQAGLVVNIRADGTIVVNGVEETLENLAALVDLEIKAMPSMDPAGVRLLVRADQKADTGALNQVVTMLRAKGVGLARLATEVP